MVPHQASLPLRWWDSSRLVPARGHGSMRLFWTTACTGGGGDGRDVLQAPGGFVSFLMQLSFPVSNKHGKCAFGALGPAPDYPVALSSALRRGVTAHHEVRPDFSLQALLTYSLPPLREPSLLHSILFLAVPLVPLSSHSFYCSHLFPRSFQSVSLLHLLYLPLPVTSLPHHSLVPPYLIHPYCVFPSSFSAPFPPSFCIFPSFLQACQAEPPPARQAD